MGDADEKDSEDDAIEGDDASDERHLFGEERPTTTGFVASRMGVLRVELAPDRIGGFGLVDRTPATDVAADGQTVVIGTDEDVLVDADGDGEFTPLEFGPSVAVGTDGNSVFVAAPDGEVSKATVKRTEDAGVQWELLGAVSGPRRFDGDLLATEIGVVQAGERLDNLGLRDVADVTRGNAEISTLAATEAGLYRHDDGNWTRELDTPVRRVTVEGDSALVVARDGRLLRGDGDSWTVVSLPNGTTVFDVAGRGSLYAVTVEGEVLIAAESTATSDGLDGWHTQPLGVRDVTGFVLLGD